MPALKKGRHFYEFMMQSNNFSMKTQEYRVNSGTKTLCLGARTRIMGIINCTPDSFSDGGQFDTVDKALAESMKMAHNGASIIDIGGESTRPGSGPVSFEEELERVLPVIEAIRRESDIWISIDTYKAPVAREALKAGADMINDISGLRFDTAMPKLAAEYEVPVIVMHILGTPTTMQIRPDYDNVVTDIYNYFSERIESLEKSGIGRDKILLDPGIGFGKTLEHNLSLLNNLEKFAKLERPVLVGPSRKSFLGTLLDLPVDDRLEGTAAAVVLAITRGAHVVRVHDVLEIARAVRVTDAILSEHDPDHIG